MRILVGYASAHGSTREIAERLAARLREQGLEVDCAAVQDGPAVGPYDAVVVGSAIHNAAWLPEADSFVNRAAPELARRPVWLFSVGMPDALGRILRRLAAKSEAAKVTAPYRVLVSPRGERLFSGVFLREHTSPGPGRAFRLLGGRFGDFRDWPAIDAWADEIATALRLEVRGAPGTSSPL